MRPLTKTNNDNNRLQKQCLLTEEQSYIKLCIKSIELFDHLVFYSQDNKQIKNDSNIQVAVSSQLINNSNNRINNSNKNQIGDNTIIMRNIKRSKISSTIGNQQSNHNNNQHQQNTLIRFQQLNNHWNCIKINNKESNNDVNYQLVINYNLTNTVNVQTMKLVNNIIKLSQNTITQTQSQQLKNNIRQQLNNKQQLNNNIRQKIKKHIKLSSSPLINQQHQSITLPIEKLLKQSPYTINQLTIDLYLSTHLNIDNKVNQQQNKKQRHRRDGIINLSIVYLPNIRPQILFKNIKLNTKHFTKQYQLTVKEIVISHHQYDNASNKTKLNKQQSTKRNNYIQQDNNNNTYTDNDDADITNTNINAKDNRNMKIVSMRQIPLIAQNWGEFINKQSHKNQLVMPLMLNNNLDQLQFTLTKTQDNHNQPTSSLVIDKKTIAIEHLYEVKHSQSQQSTNKWSKYQINFNNNINKYNNSNNITYSNIKYNNNRYNNKNNKQSRQEQQSYRLQLMFNLTLNLPTTQSQTNQPFNINNQQQSQLYRQQQLSTINQNQQQQNQNPFLLLQSIVNQSQ